MARPSWKGVLRLNLVSVPVQAFNAESSTGGDVRFHQLHDKCKSRIKYMKTCPVHGEIENSEIVKGYEFAKDEYVIVDEDEIDKLRGESEQAIDLETFVKPGTIDPKYFDGRTYYLLPDGDNAERPYAVLLEVLAAKGLWGVAIASFSHREHLSILRATEDSLCLETLHYPSDLRGVSEVRNGLSLPKVQREEARLASMLIDASTTKKFDINKYHDDYNDQLRALVEAKVEGREIVAPPQVERAPTVSFMDALKKSVSKSKVATARKVATESLSRSGKPRRAGKRKSAG